MAAPVAPTGGGPNFMNIIGAAGELGKILNSWAAGSTQEQQKPGVPYVNPYSGGRPSAQMSYRFPWAHPRGRSLASKRI